MRKLIRKIIKWAMKDPSNKGYGNQVEMPVEMSKMHSSTRRLRFNVYQAQGGLIIETLGPSNLHDEQEIHLYIVTSTEDLAKQLEKILTYDNLVR